MVTKKKLVFIEDVCKLLQLIIALYRLLVFTLANIFTLIAFLNVWHRLIFLLIGRVRLQDFLRSLPSVHESTLPFPNSFLTCFIGGDLVKHFLCHLLVLSYGFGLV